MIEKSKASNEKVSLFTYHKLCKLKLLNSRQKKICMNIHAARYKPPPALYSIALSWLWSSAVTGGIKCSDTFPTYTGRLA